MDQLTTFAQRLRYAMVAKGLTNTSLAKLCGINRSNITRYLSGEYIAKQDVVYRIASKLDVDPQWLMGQSNEAVLERVNSVEPLLLSLIGLDHAEKVQALLDANLPDKAAELCESYLTKFSHDELHLIKDYRDASDEIRESAADMLHKSAERNRKDAVQNSFDM